MALTERSSSLTRYANLFRHVKNPGLFFRNKFSSGISGELIFELGGDVTVAVPPNRMVEFKCIVLDDCYLKGFRPEAFPSDESMVAVDIGANLGFFSLYLASRFPKARVYAVEPLRVNFDYLVSNLQRNDQVAVEPIYAAVASQEGSLTLYSSTGEYGFPTDSSMISANGDSEAYEVSAIPLQSLMEQHDLDRIHFLKVDCEGAEYDIFYNTPSEVFDRVELIAMETHAGDGEKENTESICLRLEEMGFQALVAQENTFVWAARDPSLLNR